MFSYIYNTSRSLKNHIWSWKSPEKVLEFCHRKSVGTLEPVPNATLSLLLVRQIVSEEVLVGTEMPGGWGEREPVPNATSHHTHHVCGCMCVCGEVLVLKRSFQNVGSKS